MISHALPHSRRRRALAGWFSLALIGLAIAAAPAEAQSRRRAPPSYGQIGIPDQKEGAAILEKFRNIGLAGPYYLEFELRLLPRVKEERRMAGRWFGSRNVTGPVTRIELVPELGKTESWLIQSGPRPAVWRVRDGRWERIEGEDVMQPLAGTTISAADLQTPFMFWTDFTYEQLVPFRGRPTHVFLLYPPEEEVARYPGVGGVRVYIDTQFAALIKAEWVDPEGEPLKTITILDLKKIQDRWIVKSFEVRDEHTRDKTRFVVTAAALDLKLPDAIFNPAAPVESVDLAIAPGELTPVR